MTSPRAAALALLALSAVLSVTMVSCSRGPDLKLRTRQMIETANRHDVTAQLAFYSDSAVFVLRGMPPITGKAELRRIFEWDSTLGTQVTVEGLSVRGDTVVQGTSSESNGWLRMMGVEKMHTQAGTRVIYHDGLVERVELAEDFPSEQEAYRDSLASFMRWFTARHPEIPPGAQDSVLFRFSGASAKAWLGYLGEWRGAATAKR
jgi:hypothetical protein